MKKINRIDQICLKFHNLIEVLQSIVFLVDEIMEQYKKIVHYICISTGILLITFAELNCKTGAILTGGLLMIILHINFVKGWCHSVRKYSLSVILTNFYFIVLVGTVTISSNLSGYVSSKRSFIVGMAAYCVIWMILTLIAETEVAKIANQIISILFTILFTVGTYIVSLELGNVPSLNALESAYKTTEQLEAAMNQSPELMEQIFKSMVRYGLEQAFLYSLPFLCVSLFCTLEVDLKEYWLKKNGKEDFWARMERERKEHRKSVDTGKETE